MDVVHLHLRGTAPLLMHNGRLANPFDPFAIAMKAITKKRTKTEEDALAIYWTEWCGSLYTDQPILPSIAEKAVVRPVVPEGNLLSFINDGARHSKQGQDVWRACKVIDTVPIEASGWPLNKTLGEIYQTNTFNDIRGIVNPSTGGRSMRCRPIFRDWEITFSVAVDTEMLNPKDVIAFVERAARYNGLCDGKPMFGRCEASVVKKAGVESKASKNGAPEPAVMAAGNG